MHEELSHIVLPFEPHRTRFTVSITVARERDGALGGLSGKQLPVTICLVLIEISRDCVPILEVLAIEVAWK